MTENNSAENSKILSELFWAFSREKYSSKEEFSRKIKQYQIDINEKDSWQPDRIVVDKPQINLLLDMDWQLPPDDQIEFTLKSENEKGFTALDLIFQLNNFLAGYDLGDYQFFEGLKYTPETDRYLIKLGS